MVKARILNGTEWSALTEAEFLAGPLAIAGNLGVSEIMCNPAGLLEDTEFLELVNLSATDTIELGNAQFVDGIGFTFPINTRLAPGARILVVANLAAFEAEYGAGHPVAGQYTGNLDNDGEQLIIQDAFGIEILNFTYNDGAHWPIEADGKGRSLVLRAPALSPDLNDPLSWRDSTAVGGDPDATDSVTFTGDPNADNDGDGLDALLEHGIGTNDSVPDPAARSISPALDPAGHFTVTITLNLLASDIETELQSAHDLVAWAAVTDFALESITRDAVNGTAVLVYRSLNLPGATGDRDFLRWRVTTP